MTSQKKSMSATVQATFDLARKFVDENKLDTAQDLFEICLFSKPKSAAIWDQYARLLYKKKQYSGSVVAFQKAVSLDDRDNSLLGLSEALSRVRRFDEAVFHRSIVLNRGNTHIEVQRSQARDLRNAGKCEEAIRFVDSRETTARTHPRLRLQRALAYLTLGDYEHGFSDYESRIESENLQWPKVNAPKWNGEDLMTKSILIFPEQGFGDAVISARFLPALKARGAHVTMYVKPPLRRLFETLEGLDEIIEDGASTRGYDYHCPIFSLPHILGITASSLPSPAKLHIPDSSQKRAKGLTAPYADNLKIGIVWTGTDQLAFNQARRIDPHYFGQLAEIPGVQLFSLYKGTAIKQLAESGLRGTILDVCSSDQDFADSAGIISEMDLMITSDTAVVHVAASLGKPVWNLLPSEGFWFYGTGDTTPWYPSMRIYRQKEPGAWQPVFDQVKQDLASWMENRTPLPQQT